MPFRTTRGKVRVDCHFGFDDSRYSFRKENLKKYPSIMLQNCVERNILLLSCLTVCYDAFIKSSKFSGIEIKGFGNGD